MYKIAVVDDEVKIRDIVRVYLEKEGYKVVEAGDGIKALELVEEETPDLIVLDVMLPGKDGLEVCKKIRQTSMMPILMLTAKGEEIDKIIGLELGADDYLVKPFSPRELMARIKALLRRTHHVSQEAVALKIAGIEIEVSARKVIVDGAEITLTPKEFDLLHFFVQNKGLVLSRERILEKIWGYDYFGDLRTVDTHVKNLREKLTPNYASYIKTVWGVGYKFEVAK